MGTKWIDLVAVCLDAGIMAIWAMSAGFASDEISIMALSWVLLLFTRESYGPHVCDDETSTLRGTTLAAVQWLLLAWAWAFIVHSGNDALSFVGIAGPCLVCSMAVRLAAGPLIRNCRRHGLLLRRTMIVGGAADARQAIRLLRDKPGLGYLPVCVCLTGDIPLATDDAGVPVYGPNDIFRTGPTCEAAFFTRSCTEQDVLTVKAASQGLETIRFASTADRADRIGRARLLARMNLVEERLYGGWFYRRFGKRILDVACATILLIPATPIMLGAMLMIRREGPGPVLFAQERVGKDGKPFTLFKLRSMRPDATCPHYRRGGALLYKRADDPRITRVGRFLRRASIDELPQLVNVLKGDMSLVGPRPQVAEEVAAYDEAYALRLTVKPGITGLWQVMGRSELDIPTSRMLDVKYVQTMSLGIDLSILLRTIAVVLTRKGAY